MSKTNPNRNKRKKFTVFKLTIKLTSAEPVTEDQFGETLRKHWENHLIVGTTMKGKLIGIA